MTQQTGQDADQRPSYKDTLNLLETGFGMRANAIHRNRNFKRSGKRKALTWIWGATIPVRYSPFTTAPHTPTAPYTWATP